MAFAASFRDLAALLLTGAMTVLSACGGADGSSVQGPLTSSADVRTRCGTPVGRLSISSPVLAVYDGDTVTVSDGSKNVNVRLEGIDAPELAQPFGPESRDTLRRLLLQRHVVVTYTSTDRYGRVLGSVFMDDCTHANQAQIESGMAWFYVAYQCDLPAELRLQFRSAQKTAQEQKRGLWTQAAAQAPWVYRNDNDPPEPVCPG